MTCTPGVSDEIVKVAFPPLTVTVPRVWKPSVKVTVPVDGAGPDSAATVAVKVTAWPAVDGFADELRFVDVLI